MFPKELSNEFIQIHNVSAEKYPPLEHLKQNFGDSTVRVKWRAKQTLDTAFLMQYCQDMAEYYVHIEDDVITRPGYVREISDFINASGSSWSVLELSLVGAFGKVFRHSDLPKLVNLLTSFYEEQPVDYLFMLFKSITVQTKQYVRIPTVFKHIGAKSTLVNQTRSDGMDSLYFYMQPKRLKGDNPNATIETNFGVYQEHYIDKAYNKLNSDFVWGYTTSPNNFVLIIFTVPQNVTKVVFDLGFIADENNVFKPLNISSNLKRRDYIIIWSLDYSNELVSKGTSSTCDVFRHLQEYIGGPIQVEDVLKKTNGHVNCLRLYIVSQVNWIFIREIGVYVTS
ncbi:hypothetical protein ACJMK2_038823 [Sinanodonta woodiana]|uniref:MGAT4 conserved region domain-containing protein n=1 Tax=Sinanodonta woodiana TaxID=1069815 RepID=A0ABD3WB72_SINWO